MTKSTTESEPLPSHDHLIRVCYRDTDQMGIVYHANYLVFMEIGRVELLRARGWTYRDMERQGIRIPVIHASCDYLRPALYDDLVRVRTTMTACTRVRIEFAYEIHCDERGALLANGATRHVFADTRGEVARISPETRSRLVS